MKRLTLMLLCWSIVSFLLLSTLAKQEKSLDLIFKVKRFIIAASKILALLDDLMISSNCLRFHLTHADSVK